MSKATLDKWFPRNGPCFCHSTRYARHRMVDTIKARNRAGETVAEMAEDYDLPEEAIIAAINSKPSDNRMTKKEMRKA